MVFFGDDVLKKIREGFYSAEYFNRTKNILLEEKNLASVTMQIFQKNESTFLCGVNEVVELLYEATGFFQNGKWVDTSKDIEIRALRDGDIVGRGEPVMYIIGPYAYFAHLESVYLGILARRTRVATRTYDVVCAARGKPVVFFADRFDTFLNQEGDGYAAKVAGISGVSTPAHAFLWQGKPMGTIPHALIAVNNGDTIKAAEQFVKHYPDIPLIVLVDFHNDCVGTSLAVARTLGSRLFGVRLDTSENMVDRSLADTQEKSSGVTQTLVRKVRERLDREGFGHVKIVVSGGFTKEKIATFEKEETPVDIYGVGSYLLQGSNDFTADIVKVNGRAVAKAGRKFIPNPRMKKY